ncbi:hypothetical protein [Corallibacter sp.]|uniref:hypothetical protein n=1 Tax=Corallibacter sp. TaxID=2038084 RepID=UPI003AB688D2
MTERKTYFSIAERYLSSAQNELANANPYLEVVAFKFYHSYECLASSLTLFFNRKVPKSHPKKLNTFLALAKKEPRPLNIHNVAYLNMLFENQRNKYLYPEIESTGNIKAPQNQIDQTKINNIRTQVEGIHRNLRPII